MSQATENTVPPIASEAHQPDAPAQVASGVLRGRWRAEILATWEAAVRAHPMTQRTAHPVLRELVPDILDGIAEAAEQGEPASGARLAPPIPPVDERLELAQVVAEYMLLRAAIARVIERVLGESPHLQALRALDRAIDDAVTSLADRFAQELRRAAEHTTGRLRFLADATAALASSLNYDQTLERVAQLAVPVLADWCVVDLVEEHSGELRRVSVAHRDPALSEVARGWAAKYPTEWVASRGVSEVIRTGEPELVGDISDPLLVTAAHGAGDLEALRALGLRSYLIVPLVARDRKLGAITLVSAASGRRYGASDVELARELARRAALAVDNARSYFEAQEAIRAREQILAIVSHDLRSPLSAVSLIVSMLRTSHADPDTAQQLEIVLGAVDRMKRLINDMLDTSAIQSGRLTLERKAIDPAPLVLEAIESHRPMAHEKQIAIAHEIEADARISCDPGRIAQVLGNLLGNAIKFCRPRDQIRVRASDDRDHVRFEVADTGPGIPADDLPHIFEPYWTSMKDTSQGSGLGLYICKGIIEAHGGRIWAESASGEGTRVRFTVPVWARA